MTEGSEFFRNLVKVFEQERHNGRSGGIAVSGAKDAGKPNVFLEFVLVLKFRVGKTTLDFGASLHGVYSTPLTAAKRRPFGGVMVWEFEEGKVFYLSEDSFRVIRLPQGRAKS